ncbi:MAG: hypothetical protein Tsb009_05670 [Planctomycetaceae bacterium]
MNGTREARLPEQNHNREQLQQSENRACCFLARCEIMLAVSLRVRQAESPVPREIPEGKNFLKPI